MGELTEIMNKLDEIMLEATLVLVSDLPDNLKRIRIVNLSKQHQVLADELKERIRLRNEAP